MERDIAPKNNAFSLVELIVAIVVIGILVAIAVPNYNKAKERALVKEAISNLNIVAASEKIYYVEHSTYTECANTAACNEAFHLQLDGTNWKYRAEINGNGTQYNAYATRKSGSYEHCEYLISSSSGSDEVAQNPNTDCP